jgi:excisionase family DNA binding protein
MADESTDIPAGSEVLRVLLRIEEHLAALRNGAHAATSQWLTIDEVAEELRLSRETVERLIAAGRLRAAELTTQAGRGVRRRHRIRRDWMEAFLIESAQPSQKSARKCRRPRASRTRIDFIG